MGTLRRALVAALTAVVGFGCDFGVGGSAGSGCARISQGDYAFPEKDILRGAVAARITQSGLDFITARVKALVLAFFDADENGRAVIPLGDLGVGALSTSLGPLDAEVRDLVLTLDLSRLSVTLVPGSSPARLEVYVENAEVGLVDGTVAGTIDAFLFSGDAACGLANGPDGRVALVTMRLVLEIATSPSGAIDVNVLPSQFDLQDIAITMVTDCDRPECLDGLPPGSVTECLECDTICPAADFAADLVSIVQEAFDGLVDQLMNVLADEVANLVLDGFLNGKPLAVEGTLDIGTLLSPILKWMDGARPLGVLAKPAGQAFRVTGAGATLGLDVVLDAGVQSGGVHACVAGPWGEREFLPGPRPTFDGYAQTDGGLVPYDVGLGVSAAVINEAVWELWKTGALCIAVETDDIATLSGGKLVVTARTLDLLMPGIAGIAGPDAPVRIVVRPQLDAGPEYVTVASGGERLMTIGLEDAQVAVETLVGDGWLRMISFEADLALGLGMTPKADGAIEIRIADVALGGLVLPDNQIFQRARLDVIAPFVVELALGFLTEQPLSFELGLSGLASGLGIPMEPVVVGTGAAGDQRDWLAFYVQLKDPPAVVPLRAGDVGVEVDGSGPGWMELRAGLPSAGAAPFWTERSAAERRKNGAPRAPERGHQVVEGAGPGAGVRAGAGEGASADLRFQVRVAGGRWSRVLDGAGPHRIEAAHLWLVGRWPIEVRAIDGLGRAGAGEVRGEVVVLPPLMQADAVAVVIDVEAHTACAEPVGDEGCVGAEGGIGALIALWLLRPRRRS